MVDSIDDLDAASVVATLEQAFSVQQRLFELYRELVDAEVGDAREGALDGLQTERDFWARELGLAVLRHVAAGGELVLETFEDDPPEESDDAEPAAEVPGVPEALPTEPECAPPLAAGPAASDEALAALAANGLGPQWTDAVTRDAEPLRRILEGLHRPRRVQHDEDLTAELTRLHEAVDDLDRWRSLHRPVQRALLGLVGARARYVQHEAPAALRGPVRRDLDNVFRALTAFSGKHEPGWVAGLGRDNPPEHGSWFADAVHWWDRLAADAPEPEGDRQAAWARLERLLEEEPERKALWEHLVAAHEAGIAWSDPRLVDLVTPYGELLKGTRTFKTLRAQVRRAAETEAREQAEADRSHPLPPDWPFLRFTEGKVACVLGGDQRADAAQRLQDSFRFSEVTWERGDVRRVQGLAKRIRSGSVDLLLILRRFVSHHLLDHVIPACRESDVPFAVVDTGYGVVQVRLAIERYLDGLRP